MAEKRSGRVARLYELTDAGKEAFPVVEEFEKRVDEALKNYKSRMTEIADKYNIPEDQRSRFMGVLLNSWAAELFGFSTNVSQYIQGLKKD